MFDPQKSISLYSGPDTEFTRVEITPLHMLDLGGRSLGIVGRIFDDVAKGNPAVKSKAGAIARIGSAITAVARILTPGSIQGTLYKHWMAIAWVVAGFLGVAAFFDEETYLRPAAHLAILLVCVGATIWLTGIALRNGKLLLGTVAFLFAAGFASLVGYGATHLSATAITLDKYATRFDAAKPKDSLSTKKDPDAANRIDGVLNEEDPASLSLFGEPIPSERILGVSVTAAGLLLVACAWTVITRRPSDSMQSVVSLTKRKSSKPTEPVQGTQPGQQTSRVRRVSSTQRAILGFFFTLTTLASFVAAWLLWAHILRGAAQEAQAFDYARTASVWGLAGITLVLILVSGAIFGTAATQIRLVHYRRLLRKMAAPRPSRPTPTPPNPAPPTEGGAAQQTGG